MRRKSLRMAAEHSAGVIICYVQGRNVREVGDFDLEEFIPAMEDYFLRQTEPGGQRRVWRRF